MGGKRKYVAGAAFCMAVAHAIAASAYAKECPGQAESAARIELRSKKLTDGAESGTVVRTRQPVSGQVITYTVAAQHNVKTYEAVEGLINVKSTWVLLGKARNPIIITYDPPPDRIIDEVKKRVVKITRTSQDGVLKIPVQAAFRILRKDKIVVSGCDYAVDVYELKSQPSDLGAGVTIRYYYSELLKMILSEDFDGFLLDKPLRTAEIPVSIAVLPK